MPDQEAISTIDELKPFQDELPSAYADRLGELYARNTTAEEKKLKGQFFTPLTISRFMASLANKHIGEVSILDPGCGTGVLSICLVEYLVSLGKPLETIHLTAYETDLVLLKHSKKAFNYLMEWLSRKNIKLSVSIVQTDFILDNKQVLEINPGLFVSDNDSYDFIICNPPYFKLSKEDPRTKSAKSIINGHANIYSIFMAIASKLLNPSGELIFITPRSFSSGNYFQAFRNYFFKNVEIVRAHLFHSRKDTFSRDKVLQETIILKCQSRNNKTPVKDILVTSSRGTKDLENPGYIELPAWLVIEYDSIDKMVLLPTNKRERSIVELFKSWPGTLNRYNIQISTGPVVAHRAREFILNEGETSSTVAPLFWLHNVRKMETIWPLERPNKGQYIKFERASLPLLVENKNYLLLRRFSSKDDKSRLIAAPYYSKSVKSSHIGIENKLNYIYRPKGSLERDEIAGLAALLNSELFDGFFRILNGNVNVSATELRLMPLPPHETIVDIGKKMNESGLNKEDKIKEMINKKFGKHLVQ